MKTQLTIKNVNKNSTILVALSGGKDSICLLDVLLKQSKQLNIKVKAVNIDHQIRGKDSETDSNFVKDYCAKLGVELFSFKVDATKFSNENGYTLEEGARILRYDVFSKLLSDGVADYLATAHHLDDNFETVLFNLFRGSGAKGLTGITECNGKIIRPLIDVSREEIDAYVFKNNLPFVEDKTNNDTTYTRNYIRHEIKPKILEKFPGAKSSVLRLTAILKDEDEYLQTLADSEIKNIDNKFLISATTPPVLLRRATITILNKLGLKKDYEKVHLDDVAKLSNLQNGSTITLPKNIVAVKDYDNIVFFVDNDKPTNSEYSLSCGEFDFNGVTAQISKIKTENSLTFDYDKLPKTAILRTRKDGDFFTKFGGGTKKLKDYFIDKKISRYKRDNIPLIANGNEILLIFGVEISDTIKIDDTTTNVYYANIKNHD